mgnify:CR=1 FL=1
MSARSKLDQLDRLTGAKLDGTDSERAYWADQRDGLRRACSGTVRLADAVAVLTRCVMAADDHGQFDLSIGQLAARTMISDKAVQRALDALKQAGLVADLKRGGGPLNRKQGKQQRQATVRRVVFLQAAASDEQPAELRTVQPVTQDSSARTQDSQLSCTNGHLRNHLPSEQASGRTRPVSEQSGGGTQGSKGSTRGWSEQLAVDVATAWVGNDRSGTIRNQRAVADTRLPQVRDYLTDWLQARDHAALELLDPHSGNAEARHMYRQLVTGLAAHLTDGGGGGSRAAAVEYALKLAARTCPPAA